MEILADRLAQRPPALLVLLPGAHIAPADFWQHGFIDAVRAHALAIDIVAAAIDPRQFMAQTAVATLHEAVILPALAAGYRHIWLAGISLGALTALLYAAQHRAHLAGLHLLAPYPGTGDICAEIRAAGGPRAWAATPAARLGDEREAWRWLAAPARSLPVSMGCATEDRFIANQRMYAELLAADQVHYVAGGHDWTSWEALWAAWLNTGTLARHLEAHAR